MNNTLFFNKLYNLFVNQNSELEFKFDDLINLISPKHIDNVTVKEYKTDLRKDYIIIINLI